MKGVAAVVLFAARCSNCSEKPVSPMPSLMASRDAQEEQRPYSAVGGAPRPPRGGGPTSEASSERCGTCATRALSFVSWHASP